MARRGTHSARHRAGGDQPGALGVAPAEANEQVNGAVGSESAAPQFAEPSSVTVVPPAVTPPPVAPPPVALPPAESPPVAPPPVTQPPVAPPPVAPPPVAPPPVAPRPVTPQPERPHAGQAGARPLRNVAIRVVAAVGAVAVVVVAGIVGTPPSGNTVAGSVKAFLLDWQTGNYAAAAALTTGHPAVVARELAAEPRQLGADDLTLALGPLPQNVNSIRPITVHGSRALVYFNATLDLGRGGLSWRYQGHFTMRRSGGGWLVIWSPSDIVPGLGPGDRLAVLTRMPSRATLLDSAGRPLVPLSTVIEFGVIPADVRHPARTADDLAAAIGLPAADAAEILGQIEASPPRSFLELLKLSPVGYARLRQRLDQVPDLTRRSSLERLFASTVPLVTGQVGAETARPLIASGQPYRPGATLGLSGLQQTYQAQLAGTPTTQIVVQDAAGKLVRVLKEWRGQHGTAVRTTIDGAIQDAARGALAGTAGLGVPAAIVAIRAGTGQILAVAGTDAAGMPAVAPLTGQYEPGQAFTIVSTAALLSSGPAPRLVPCLGTNRIGGQTFSNVPAVHLPPQPSFTADFANACSTVFVGLSLKLTASELARAAMQFGIGAHWRLPLSAYAGQLSYPVSTAEQAADVIGIGSVRVSPLDMALVAGAADAGRWSAPSLVAGWRPGRLAGRGPVFNSNVITKLRNLMLATASSGAARGAKLTGTPLYGQVGSAPLGGHPGIHVIWFVGFRGNVAFAVTALSRSTAFDPAVLIARLFAQQLRPGS